MKSSRVRPDRVRPGLLATLSVLTFALAGPPALAQSADKAPVLWAAAMAPGGLTDVFAREMAKAVGERSGQTIVVQPIGGGGGLVAANKVKSARPDGTAFLVSSNSLIVNQAMRKTPDLDIHKDLVAVAMLMEGPFGFYVNTTVSANNLGEFIQLAKASPGKFNYGSSGIGSIIHLVTEDFLGRTGTRIVHVPYKGGAELKMGLTCNQVQLNLVPLNPDPAMKLLAITSRARLPSMPNTPTAIEAGLRDFEPTWWIAIFAPAATPPDLLTRLNSEVRAILATPDMKRKFAERDWTITTLAPRELHKRIEEETARWSRLVDDARIERM